MATKKIKGPVLVRTSKPCFMNNNRYAAGDTFIWRGEGELPEHFTLVEEAAPADEPAGDAQSPADDPQSPADDPLS